MRINRDKLYEAVKSGKTKIIYLDLPNIFEANINSIRFNLFSNESEFKLTSFIPISQISKINPAVDILIKELERLGVLEKV